jgi:uncharacterized membrane-anchored protein YitT (DUF2179 family)
MAISETDVQRILDYDREFVSDVQPFIDDAVIFLTAVIGAGVVSNAVFDMVTNYITAHFISITDPRVHTEQVKSLLVTYQNKLDKGLGITHFGTMAMMLDTSGKLAAWNQRTIDGKGAVQFFWAGSPNP